MAVISTVTLFSAGDKAFAETVDKTSVLEKSSGIVSMIIKGGVSSALPSPVQEIINWLGEFVKIIKEIPHNIASMSAELLVWVYKLISDLLLQTPLFLFENDWFMSMLQLFSSVSVAGVLVLTVIEGIKVMVYRLNKQKIRPMKFKDIIVRWGIVSGISAIFPTLFKAYFKGLNFVSHKLMEMNTGIMEVAKMTDSFGVVDTLVLLGFDIMLISTVIPLLLSNGKRFFDLLVLGVVSPVAIACWIFDSKKHFFNQWWSNVKQLSLVQVYHSFFLLIIGLFLFGTAFPLTFTGGVIKILVVLGAFQRMANPPKLISKHMDYGKENAVDLVKNPFKDISKHLTKNFSVSKNVITAPLKWFKKK